MADLDFILQRKILKLGNKLVNTRNVDLKTHDLTPNQSETLLYFDAHPGEVIVNLKDYLEISHQAARNIIERMKLKSLLYVTVSAADARARQVYLTAKGQTICDQLKVNGTSVGHTILSQLSVSERQQLAHLLDKITDQF